MAADDGDDLVQMYAQLSSHVIAVTAQFCTAHQL